MKLIQFYDLDIKWELRRLPGFGLVVREQRVMYTLRASHKF